MVDEATAKRFARACRLEAGWARWVTPSVIVAAVGILLIVVIDAVRGDQRLLSLAVLLALVLAGVTSVGRLMLFFLRSRHHPQMKKHGVLIRAVDREVAQLWVDLNPRGGIEILG